jgi:hypothetical protein
VRGIEREVCVELGRVIVYKRTSKGSHVTYLKPVNGRGGFAKSSLDYEEMFASTQVSVDLPSSARGTHARKIKSARCFGYVLCIYDNYLPL